jgi:type II secretory pathway predicted ATPase ExeA
VTGEVGAGKTMLCRMLESRMPPHIDVIYLVNPNLNPLEVQHAIAAELGLPTSGLRADEVQRSLHAELIARHSAGRQVVLLVEEAQAMPLDTLEAIRLLTNWRRRAASCCKSCCSASPSSTSTWNWPACAS